MRFGVERPEEFALPIIRATGTPRNSEKLDVDGEGVIAVGVAGAELLLREEWVGGEGGLVDE